MVWYDVRQEHGVVWRTLYTALPSEESARQIAARCRSENPHRRVGIVRIQEDEVDE